MSIKLTPRQKKLKRLCQKFNEQVQNVFDEMECKEAESQIGDLVVCAQGYAAEVADQDEWEW